MPDLERVVRSNYDALRGCDLNSDGIVNVVDLQIAIEEASGVRPCTNADLTVKANCTVADVQRVVAAVLGHPCPVTR